MWATWFAAAEGHVGWNLWSQDSKALYFETYKADHVAWWRIGVGEKTPTKIADLPDERSLLYSQTLAPDGGALYARDLSTSEIYALHLSEK